MSAGTFELDEDADALVRASVAWGDVARALDDAGDDVQRDSRATLDAGWEGESATSYDAHRKRLVGDLDLAATSATTVSSTMGRAAGAVRVAQGRLDGVFADVASIEHVVLGGTLWFLPEDDAEQTRVDRALSGAQEVRDGLDRTLAADETALQRATQTFQDVTARWQGVYDGSTPPFSFPEGPSGTGVITVGGETVIATGPGNDVVSIRIDPDTGEQIVLVNGEIYRIPAGQHITVRTGAGHDSVNVAPGSRVSVTVSGSDGDDHLTGGDGDDTILGLDGRDEIDGGDGDDYASGGDDRDYLNGQDGDDTVSGGSEDDTLYGLDGDDTLVGGEGQDYQEGGTGDDTVVGLDGDDIGSGGDGDDTIVGGTGDDVSYAGRGDDTTYGGTGTDTSNSEAGDTDAGDVENTVTVEITAPPDYIKIEGSPEFVARVQADLQLLASSPRGQELLANLQQNYDESGGWFQEKDGLTISEYAENDNSFAHEEGNGSGVVEYSQRVDEIDGAPPVVVLYHELGHVYDFVNETYDGSEYQGDDTTDHGIKQSERQAAGLPIDHDHDPSTPEVIDPDHPIEYTENGIREEMGVPHRDHYR